MTLKAFKCLSFHSGIMKRKGIDVSIALGFHSVYFFVGNVGLNGDGLQTEQLLSAAGTGFRPMFLTWNIEFVSKQIFTNRYVLIR